MFPKEIIKIIVEFYGSNISSSVYNFYDLKMPLYDELMINDTNHIHLKKLCSNKYIPIRWLEKYITRFCDTTKEERVKLLTSIFSNHAVDEKFLNMLKMNGININKDMCIIIIKNSNNEWPVLSLFSKSLLFYKILLNSNPSIPSEIYTDIIKKISTNSYFTTKSSRRASKLVNRFHFNFWVEVINSNDRIEFKSVEDVLFKNISYKQDYQLPAQFYNRRILSEYKFLKRISKYINNESIRCLLINIYTSWNFIEDMSDYAPKYGVNFNYICKNNVSLPYSYIEKIISSKNYYLMLDIIDNDYISFDVSPVIDKIMNTITPIIEKNDRLCPSAHFSQLWILRSLLKTNFVFKYIHLFEKINYENLWYHLCINNYINDKVLPDFEKNIDKLYWYELCCNKSVPVKFLEKYKEYIFKSAMNNNLSWQVLIRNCSSTEVLNFIKKKINDWGIDIKDYENLLFSLYSNKLKDLSNPHVIDQFSNFMPDILDEDHIRIVTSYTLRDIVDILRMLIF